MNYAGKFGSSGLEPFSPHFDLDSLSQRGHTDSFTVPDAHLLFSGDYHRSGQDLIISDDLQRVLVPGYFHGGKRPVLVSPDGAPLDPRIVDALTGHVEYAQAGGAPAAKVVGHVVKMTGSASIVRNGVTIDLQSGDAVYQSDVVQTGSNSTLGLVLNDGTTFNLTANARLMLNDLTYDAGSTSNVSLITLVQGAASFVAGQIAKTGDMKVATPIATVGIRGTAVLLDISSTDGKVSISVVDQRDGQVHAVQVFNTNGVLIGTVTSNGAGLTLTPTATFDVIAQESSKTVAQIAQEFNAFNNLLQTYDVGKQLFPNLPQHTENGNGNNANPQQTKFAGSTPPASSGTEIHSVLNPGSSVVNQTSGGTTPVVVTVSASPAVVGPTGSLSPPLDSVVIPTPVVTATSVPFVVKPPTVAPITTGASDHSGPVMSASGDVVYDPDGIIYFYDRESNTTTRVSADDGLTYSGQTISSDGRFIAYQGSDGTHTYVYVWGTDSTDAAHYHVQTLLVAGSSPAISGDGSTILVERAGGSIGIFDLDGHPKGTITPAAVGISGTLWKPAISADGHLIAFWSSASASSGGAGHLYTYDLSTGVVAEIASTDSGAGTTAASISADGHFVVYQVQMSGGHSEIYLYDTVTHHIVFSTAGAAGASWNPVISPDGHFIIFTSSAQLTAGDTNSYADTYVVDVTNPAAPVYKLVSEGANAASDGGVAISAGDQYEAFASSAGFSGIGGGNSHIFVVDPTEGRSAVIQETANSPSILSAAGLIQITGGVSGVALSVSDASGNATNVFTAQFDAQGNIQWNFSEAKSDFASLQYGQDAKQVFFITLGYKGGLTTIPVTVTVHDAAKPAVTPVDVAPVASPVKLPDGQESVSYTITAQALLAGVGDIDGPSLSITNVTIRNGGGTLVDNHDGTWSYTPVAGFHGAVVFNYTVSDGTLTASSTADLSILNDPATISGDTAGGVVEDTFTTAGGTLTVYDIDVGEAVFQPVPVAALAGTYGNFTFDSSTGEWTYALVHAKANSLGEGQVVHDALRVTSADGTASQLIDITITGTNDAPVVTAGTVENGAIIVSAMPIPGEVDLTSTGAIDFSDPDFSDTHGVQSVTYTGGGSALGMLTLVKAVDTTGTGTGGQFVWTYSADTAAVRAALDGMAAHSKIETFEVVISDGHGGTITRAVSVTLTETGDHAPVATPVTLVTGTEDTVYTIDASTLLAAVSDIDGPFPLFISALSIASGGGSLVDNHDGTWSYTPASNYNGPVSFNYTASDGTLTSSSTASLNLAADNDAPVALPVILNPGVEDTIYTVTAAALLAGVYDIDGPFPLSISDVSIASGGGSLIDHHDGTWSYTPAQNYNGPVSFNYTASDGTLTSSSTASLTLTAVNDAPIATPVALSPGTEDTAYTITASALLTGVSDIDGPFPLSISDVSLASGGGSLIDNQDGTWSYTPAQNYNGPVSFNYTASDGTLTSSSTASLTLTAVNDTPTAVPVTLSPGLEDTTYTIDAAALLSGVGDIDGPFPLSISEVNIASGGGSLVDNQDGTWSYTPATHYSGPVSFNYTVSDGSLTASSTASLMVQVDTGAPTVKSVVTTGSGITAGAGIIGAGHVVTLTVSMSEAVTVANGVPTLTLNDGGIATYQSGSGGSALIFTYTVGAGENTSDLAITAFAANGATIADSDGNVADMAGAVTNPAGTLQVDTSAPAAPNITGVTDDVSPVTGPVADNGSSNDTTLTLAGTAEAGSTVTIYDTDGTTVVGSGIATGGSFSITTAALGAGSHTLTAKATDTAGNQGSASTAFHVTIDTSAPVVSSEAITSASGIQNNTLNAGDVVSVTATFSENVTVSGTPQLALNIGGTTVQASYTAGSGSNALVFTYTIQSGQNDANGINIDANALSLNGGSITDAAGNAAALTAVAVADDPGYKVSTAAPAEALEITSVVGSSSPGDTSVTISGTNGELAAGDKIQVSSDNGATWTAVVQNTKTSWSLVDNVTHTADFSYQVRIVDTVGNSKIVSQPVRVAYNGGTVSAGASAGLIAEFTGTGGILALGPSDITGTVNAISVAHGAVAINGSGSLIASTGDGIHLTATGGTQANPADLSVNLTGPTFATGGTAISVVQNAAGAITIATSGDVLGLAGRGIFAEQSATGTGSILVTGSGTVSGAVASLGDIKDDTGIFAANLNAANANDVTVSHSGAIFGGIDGIRALTNGNGNVTVSTGPATVYGTTRNAIEATSNGRGNIVVTTAVGGILFSGSSGISANNQATSIPQVGGITASSISVTANGTINSGTTLTGSGSRPAGVLAGYKGGTTNTPNAAVFGNVIIDNFADINAAGGDGIRGYNYGSGDVTINDHAGVIVAKDMYGIAGVSYGIGKVSITTAAGTTVNSGSHGISAVNLATAIAAAAGSTVTVEAHGTIHSGVHLSAGGSQPQGISAGYFPGNVGVSNTSVNGTVFVDNFADIIADAGWGIDAYNFGNGNVTVVDEAGTYVSGGQFGIGAYSSSSGSGSSGNVTINVGAGATISASTLYGQSGIAANVSHGGSISITTSNGDIVNSGGTGIQASITASSALASSQISITAAGTINSGFNITPSGNQPGGMWIGYSPGAGTTVTPNVHGNVVVDSAATINATSGVGIGLYNWGVGNVTATLGSDSDVSGVTAGLNSFANGGGDVTITNDGTVAATSGYGIFAGTGTALATTGNGTISITNSGAIASLGLGNSTVVQINNWSTKDATFTNSATGSVTANLFSASNLNQALGSYNGTNSTNIGRVTVNNSGTISGNASFSASFSISGATFNNNAGGLWKINGSNWFGGTSNAINNAGTIRTSGAAYLSAGGSLALTNTGTIDVLANSAAFIYANLSGNGTVTIGDRSALELGGSVAATQTISFAGKGLLMLDNPSTASNFTIAGLSVGDTIDLLGGIVIANAGITGSTLNIATNSQTFSYQVTGVQANTAFNVLSVDKIVLVSTTNTITITGQSTPYFDNPSLEKSYIFANDAISGSGVGINIAATDSISAHTISAYINQTSSVSVAGSAVNMTTSGANIALVNAANLNSSGAAGIFTNSTTGSNDVVDYGNVSGQTVGISSRVSGSNPLNIVVGGAATVSGTGASANGIFALSTSSGAIGITTMPGATINSGATGILAQNQGTSVPSSSISISTSGTINAGSTGISASYLTGSSPPSTIPNPPNTTVHGDIEINNSAAITAGTGVGIAVTNYGVGDISVSNNATITATAAGATTPGVTQTQYGISAFNYGSGNTTVTTGFGSVIQSGGTGLNVGNQATVVAAAAASTVTVVAQGSIHSGANTNNSGSAPSGIQAGFNPGNAGVFNSNVFGDVLVNNNANIIADAGDGINAYNFGTGNIAVNVGFNVSIQALTSATSASGKAPYGIGVSNYGAGDIVVAMSGGDVITSGSSGINAVNLATSIDAAAGALVAVSTAGTIHSGTILTNGGAQPSGIGAGFLGGTSAASNLNVHGTVIVNNAASVTVDAGIGINAYNYGYGDIIINDASGTTVTGVQHGIEAHAEGIGARGNIAINVYSGATVSATSTTTASYGIFALSNDIGNISVITSPGVTINSGSAGINAVNEAAVIDASENSSIVVTAAGTVNSGSHATGTGNAPAGILAGYLGGSGIPASFPLTDLHGNVIVNSTATINAAAGDGIRAYTYGIGDVIVNDLAGTITALGGASPPNGSGVGIAANNFGSGNIHVSTAAGTIINAGGSGIAAVNKAASNASFAVPATSEVSVLSYGTINSGTIATGSGQPPAGILAAYNPNNSNTVDANVHGNVSVDDYASIFAATGTDGIRGANYGTGTVTIVAEAGALISAGRYGIAALGFEGGNVSVTNYATVTGGTLAVNATTTSTGTAVIDNFGHLIGGVEAYNATFTNEIGGEWSLNGVNTFTGASKLVNLGTIDSTGTSLVSGLSQITNTGTFEVISGSLELASPVSGGGAAMIYAATLQFDGASDAQVVFASPASGTLVLAHAAQFTGTVTGFSDGDIIDIQDIAPANVSVSSSGSLHVNYGTGSFDLLGSYEPMDFVIASDGGTGTKITWNHQAPIIATDQISTVQNADGTTTVLGLHVSDSDATASSETFTINAVTGAAASGTSVVPSTSSGSLTGINNVFANGVVYNPGATPPSADKVALTVTDGYGATDTVNFVFNQAGTGSNIVLQGTSGKDVIFATGGQDVLTGGGGTDQFVFKPTSSGPSVQHTITDFVAGLDKIDVREFTNISASALPTETQQGSDTLITLDGHDTLLLKNVIATTLHANDFIINA